MKTYKYMSNEVLKIVFSEEGQCSFKCSYPRDFNDPYELFLTIDLEQKPGILAHYKEVIGELPQRPVTCFSKAPNVIPMWAHYGDNHSGIVLEFDETEFQKHFPNVGFGDVDYQDKPNTNLGEMLERAYAVGKPRYHYLLQRGVFSAAYYTKHSCWSYEQERRLVASEEDIVEVGDIKLLKFPSSCISSVIVGSQATDEEKAVALEIAERIGASYYEMKIGKSSAIPFFVDVDQKVYIFASESIQEANNVCPSCREPIAETDEACKWCSINEEDQLVAAERNPFRMMESAGLLENYYKMMMSVEKGK